jgi:predicted N-acyltransferase
MAWYGFRIASTIADISPDDWDRLHARPWCPFLSRGFLALLEDSGALEQAGWTPAYALVSREGRLVACAPFYITASPAGQFTWDYGLEDVAAHYKTAWYPKLVGTVPFTPAPVWKVLADPAEPEVVSFLLASMEETARSGGFSGLHLQWVDPAFASAAGLGQEAGQKAALGSTRSFATSSVPIPPGAVPPHKSWIPWQRQVYRWDNQAYDDFAAFTASFSKNMRRNVARDRAAVAAAGIQTRVVTGNEAPPSYWKLMADYYARTNDKFGPWAARFLPPGFFELAPRYIAGLVRFSAAFRPGQDHPLALAMLFEGDEGLWGRYWGSESDEPGLHFDVCYYQPIQWAIERKLAFFDPGMGSHHKARRGFKALVVSGYHRVFDQRLAAVFMRAVREASKEEAAFAAELNRDLPFKAAIPQPGSSTPEPGAPVPEPGRSAPEA